MSFSKPHVSFSSKFASRDINLLLLKFYILSSKEPIKVQIWCHFTWAVKSLKFCNFMGSFCPNHIKFHLKKHRIFISHDTEERCKIWRRTDGHKTRGHKSDMRNLVNYNASSGKSKNLHFVVLFLLKVYYVWVKKVQRNYVS